MLTKDSGHIQWLDNDRYRLVFYLGTTPNGRPRKVYRRGMGSDAHAEAHRKRVLRELRRHGGPGPRMTVGDLLDRYCRDRAGDWRPTTQRAYGMQVARLNVALGQVPLSDLTPAMATDFKAQALRNGGRRDQPLSPKYVREHLSLLLSAVDFAVDNGWTEVNGIRRKRLLPKPGSKPVEWLEVDEIQMLLDACEREAIKPVVRILLDTGLRIGELLGLRWRDINFADGTISVRFQLQGGSRGLSHELLKTAAARRTVPFGEHTRALLETLHREAEEVHAKFGGPPLSGRR